MLRLSKKADYALLAMRHLAARAETGRRVGARAGRGVRHSAGTARQGAAEARARAAARVAPGHSRRLRPGAAGRVDVGRRRDSGDRRAAHRDGLLGDDHSCDQYAKCNIRDPLWRIKDRIVSALAATSVAELAVDLPCSRRDTGAVPVADDEEVAAMITVTETAAVADSEAAREAAAGRGRPARRRQGRRLFGLRVRVRVGSRAARGRPDLSTARAACASGSIRAVTACSTARRSTTTRACSAAASSSRIRTRRARAAAARRLRSDGPAAGAECKVQSAMC